MYQRQQNTLYPKGGRFCEDHCLKLLIGSQPIIEGRSSICGRPGYNIEKIYKHKNLPPLGEKICLLWGKGYFAADGTCTDT